MELVNLILLRDASVNGMVSLGMKMDRKVYRRSTSVREYRRLAGNHGRMGSMIQKGRKSMWKRCPRN